MSIMLALIVLAAVVIVVGTIVREAPQRKRARQLGGELETQKLEIARLSDALHARTLAAMPDQRSPREAPSPPEDLVEALATGNCVLFIGAEIAPRIGVSSWPETLRRIIEHVAEDHPEHEWDRLRRRLEANETALVADLLHTRVTPERLHKAIAASASPAGGHVAESFGLLSRLPFAGVVTDVWSDQVPALFADRKPITFWPGGRHEALMLLHRDRFFVARAHGSPRAPDTLSLSWEDYRDAVTADPTFSRFVTSLLRSRTVLFIGAHEDDVEQFLLGSDVRSSSSAWRHYALVPEHGGIDLASERLSARFGVRLLPYDIGAVVAEIDTFVEQLGAKVPPRQEQRRPVAWRPTPKLTKLRLRNIGPFDEVEIDLGAEATVLIGENASGKSTILRALALGLAGESVDLTRAAGELLRVGTSSGAIEIMAGRDIYRTALHLDRNRNRVRVVSESPSPAAAGLLFAVGFPALRGVSLRPPRGPAWSRALPPNPADLIPLAVRELDSRLDDVQQWVIDTYLRSIDPDPETAGAPRDQLKQFFEIVNKLAPGVEIEFDRVRREPWQVLIRTPDGILPLTQVSRGMTAVLGWVGVVLKRLYEINPSEAVQQPGLLLIDEVDVHIHPRWQRRILPLIRETFPQLQLVASTHSPLVVGSANDARLVHLDRDEATIAADPIDEDFDGWRSDQILTSSAFELPTTRDKHTEDLMEEYASLTAGGQLTDDERARAGELAKDLHQRLPMSQETPAARTAVTLVREALDQRIREIPEAMRHKVSVEAERYLRELDEGTGRR